MSDCLVGLWIRTCLRYAYRNDELSVWLKTLVMSLELTLWKAKSKKERSKIKEEKNGGHIWHKKIKTKCLRMKLKNI